MARKDDELANRRHAVHCAVMEANENGAPEGQVLAGPSSAGGKQVPNTSGDAKGKKRVRKFRVIFSPSITRFWLS